MYKPIPTYVQGKKKIPLTPGFLCCCSALWNRAWGTENRWLLLVYVDMDFKFLILGVWGIWLGTPFALHQSSQETFLWAFAPSLVVVVSTSSLCGFWLALSSRLSCGFRVLVLMMPVISCDLVKASRLLGRPGPISQRKVAGGQIFHSRLTELIHPTSSFLFFPPSCPFLFGLTLVTDDKAAFPAKPINKLNREKMSI